MAYARKVRNALQMVPSLSSGSSGAFCHLGPQSNDLSTEDPERIADEGQAIRKTRKRGALGHPDPQSSDLKAEDPGRAADIVRAASRMNHAMKLIKRFPQSFHWQQDWMESMTPLGKQMVRSTPAFDCKYELQSAFFSKSRMQTWTINHQDPPRFSPTSQPSRFNFSCCHYWKFAGPPWM